MNLLVSNLYRYVSIFRAKKNILVFKFVCQIKNHYRIRLIKKFINIFEKKMQLVFRYRCVLGNQEPRILKKFFFKVFVPPPL